MKISICSRFLDYIEDFDARFARMKELGFDATDFNLWELHQPCYQSVENMERMCTEARAAAEKHGLEIYQVHGPWPTDDTTPEGRVIGWNYMHQAVYGCHLLGSRYMVLHPQMPYGRKDPELDPDFAEALTMQLMEDLLPDCEKYGVTLCLENMPFEHHRLSTTARIVETVKKMNTPYVQVCFDTGHSATMRENIAESIRLAGPYLKTLHIHDNHFDDDWHMLPFSGRIKWKIFAEALVETGYEGTLNLEVTKVTLDMTPGYREHYEHLAAESAKWLRQLVEEARQA